VDQQAAALGAATIALVGLGLWQWSDAELPHRGGVTWTPDAAAAAAYDRRRTAFLALQDQAAGLPELTALTGLPAAA
jgi:sugar (pentulose or hexulose) kinase